MKNIIAIALVAVAFGMSAQSAYAGNGIRKTTGSCTAARCSHAQRTKCSCKDVRNANGTCTKSIKVNCHT